MDIEICHEQFIFTSTRGQQSTLSENTWRHGRSGFDNTNPGPMMLKVASMCMGLGSLNEMMCTL